MRLRAAKSRIYPLFSYGGSLGVSSSELRHVFTFTWVFDTGAFLRWVPYYSIAVSFNCYGKLRADFTFSSCSNAWCLFRSLAAWGKRHFGSTRFEFVFMMPIRSRFAGSQIWTSQLDEHTVKTHSWWVVVTFETTPTWAKTSRSYIPAPIAQSGGGRTWLRALINFSSRFERASSLNILFGWNRSIVS